MKAISLWQPFASAMAKKIKANETRSWKTDYRGELAIHAAKKRPTLQEFGGSPLEYAQMLSAVPFGAAVCIVELWDCVPSDWFLDPRHNLKISELELSWGNYEKGRWIWRTRNCRAIKSIPVVGHQGLFNLSPDEESAVRQQLEFA